MYINHTSIKKKKICTILAGDKDVNLTDSFLPSYIQKNIYFCFIDYVKAFDCVDHNKVENSERDGNTRPPDLPLEKPICRSGSNS